MGHYIHEYGLGKWHKMVACASIPALLLSSLLTVFVSMATGRYVYTFMLETNPLVVLASAGIFAFFKRKAGREREYDPASRLTKAVIWIGGNSFGLFLVHLAVIDCLDHYFGFGVASYPPIASVPLNSILIFTISLGIAVLLKKIPGVRAVVS